MLSDPLLDVRRQREGRVREAGESCPGWPQVGRLLRGDGSGISPRPGCPGAPPPTRADLLHGW